MNYKKCEGGGFSERSPSLALPPEEQLGFESVFPFSLRTPVSWARFLYGWLWSRRLTEPPRPLQGWERENAGGGAKGLPPQKELSAEG